MSELKKVKELRDLFEKKNVKTTSFYLSETMNFNLK
jgi:hypothetical protein